MSALQRVHGAVREQHFGVFVFELDFNQQSLLDRFLLEFNNHRDRKVHIFQDLPIDSFRQKRARTVINLPQESHPIERVSVCLLLVRADKFAGEDQRGIVFCG